MSHKHNYSTLTDEIYGEHYLGIELSNTEMLLECH